MHRFFIHSFIHSFIHYTYFSLRAKDIGKPFSLMFLPVSVDGGWSPWGNWTRCSKTCGVGYQTQHRTCTNPPPQHGGRDCQGNLDQSRQCEDQKHCPSEFKSQSHFEISWLTIIGLGFRTIIMKNYADRGACCRPRRREQREIRQIQTKRYSSNNSYHPLRCIFAVLAMLRQ